MSFNLLEVTKLKKVEENKKIPQPSSSFNDLEKKGEIKKKSKKKKRNKNNSIKIDKTPKTVNFFDYSEISFDELKETLLNNNFFDDLSLKINFLKLNCNFNSIVDFKKIYLFYIQNFFISKDYLNIKVLDNDKYKDLIFFENDFLLLLPVDPQINQIFLSILNFFIPEIKNFKLKIIFIEKELKIKKFLDINDIDKFINQTVVKQKQNNFNSFCNFCPFYNDFNCFLKEI